MRYRESIEIQRRRRIVDRLQKTGVDLNLIREWYGGDVEIIQMPKRPTRFEKVR